VIKIFDTPEYMTVDEVMEKFYPYRVVLANCEVEFHAPQAGYVVATETIPDEDYEELFEYQYSLCPQTYGETYMILTMKPHEKELLYAESKKSDKARKRHEANFLSLLVD